MKGPLLIFDGVCHLCNGTVDFVLRWEKAPVVRFAPWQGETAQGVLKKNGLLSDEPLSLIFVEEGKIHTASSAALRLARYLKAPWAWLAVFLLVPRPVRDFVYRWIARNRYRWFGRDEQCRMPTPQLQSRFDP